MRFTNEQLDMLRNIGDPEVDPMVDAYLDALNARPSELLGRLIRNTGVRPEDSSPAIEAWLATEPLIPDWYDASLIKHGEEFFFKNGPEIILSLLLAALPECYAAWRGVQVLHLTARLLSNPQRRLVETAQMVIDAMSPDGLVAGGRGYKTVRHVRLMHSGIRSLIESDEVIYTNDPKETRPHYDPDWGTPVNQEDMLGTLMTFSIVAMDAIEKMGTPVSPQEAEAYHHVWNYVGYLIGIRPDLLPLSLDEGRELVRLIQLRQFAPCDEGRDMTAAILTFARRAVKLPWLQGLPATTIRHLVGARTADIIGVPPSDWTGFVIPPLTQVMRVMSFFEQRKLLLGVVTADFNRALLEALIAVGRGGERPTFDIPTELAASWGLKQDVVQV
jgi:hypothetical protein